MRPSNHRCCRAGTRYKSEQPSKTLPTSTGASRVDEMRGGPEGEEAPPVANPTSAAKVVETCYLNYTTPLGSSDENGDLGGIVGYAKKLALDEASSMEYAMDYIYFWDSARKNNTLSSMNVIIDVDDIIPQYLREECIVPPRPSSLIDHFSTIEQGMRDSYYWALQPKHAAVTLWGYFYEEMLRLEREQQFYTCRGVATTVGDERVIITLAARGTSQLKFHELEVLGQRTWKEGDIKSSLIDMLHGLEQRTPKVEGAHSRKTCEKQLFAYAKGIGNENSENYDASSLVLGSGDRRKKQLEAAVGLIYRTLMDDM
ncbi:hypothetical protein FOZ60_012417 [Perkinsus olseni]|uniref:Uncharacterized protein n=1 Tax=Perkinsus olseni TaxID=32597 RepID=A0A7J6NCP9_PEROL|nr:hypothetical protein FOZ60_012417 [Perkinsus olseni]